MTEIRQLSLDDLKRDLILRGYSDLEIAELLQSPVLLIPGTITPRDSNTPVQKLTNKIAHLAKDLEREGLPNRVILQKNVPRQYIEERHAHVDFGTIVVSVISLQQLGTLANIAQILDFLLSLLQLKLTAGRTKELTPNSEFDLLLQDGKSAVLWHISAPADSLVKMTTPERTKAIGAILKDFRENE